MQWRLSILYKYYVVIRELCSDETSKQNRFPHKILAFYMYYCVSRPAANFAWRLSLFHTFSTFELHSCWYFKIAYAIDSGRKGIPGEKSSKTNHKCTSRRSIWRGCGHETRSQSFVVTALFAAILLEYAHVMCSESSDIQHMPEAKNLNVLVIIHCDCVRSNFISPSQSTGKSNSFPLLYKLIEIGTLDFVVCSNRLISN